jgi:hypothetical protein
MASVRVAAAARGEVVRGDPGVLGGGKACERS